MKTLLRNYLFLLSQYNIKLFLIIIDYSTFNLDIFSTTYSFDGHFPSSSKNTTSILPRRRHNVSEVARDDESGPPCQVPKN